MTRQTTWRDAVVGVVALGIVAIMASCSSDSLSPSQKFTSGLSKVNHIVVIYMENHSFDNEYGEFAGANNLSDATTAAVQAESSGTKYTTLPQVAGSPFPTTLANAPFAIEDYVAITVPPPDLVHRFYQEQSQIDGGKMDHFAEVSTAEGQVMGYYHTADLPLDSLAQHYTLCDDFFHSAFGGSFLNHQWLIAAASPTFPNAPVGDVAVVAANGSLVTDGFVTPDGYAVNTSYTVNTPHPAGTNAADLVPNQTNPTIGDRLSAKNITWAWYSGGWTNALAGNPDPLFQFHHQPFAYYANYADGTPAKATHLLDETAFFASAAAGTLPAVSFVKPLGTVNEHPGYAAVYASEVHADSLVQAVLTGPNGKDAVVIITYDENGGEWDHVGPPVIDRWGPGTRVPALIIGPFARKGFIDHTPYETVSILALIEKRFGLAALSTRDANASPLLNAFTF